MLNTCSVTENAEKDCRYAVRKTLRHSPHAFVAVTGCYAQTGASRLQSVSGIDLIVGTQFKMNLPDYLPAPTELRKQPAAELRHSRTIDREDFVLPGTAYSDSTRALLKVQDGCDFMCSFCLIPFARGVNAAGSWKTCCVKHGNWPPTAIGSWCLPASISAATTTRARRWWTCCARSTACQASNGSEFLPSNPRPFPSTCWSTWRDHQRSVGICTFRSKVETIRFAGDEPPL
ncbi:MAG: hypothetical protein HWD63_00100 [Candidatus Parvibacillus calidus]|nr:MAG: hypothetical protein HWD63_00100 [Candidatus Parvibacillus calidus]